MTAAQPPLQYLLTSSETCLEGFENARHNQIANVRKEIHQAIDEWVAAESDARISRWILDRRRAQSGFAFPEIEQARGNESEVLPLFGDETFETMFEAVQSLSLPSFNVETSNREPSERASVAKVCDQLPLAGQAQDPVSANDDVHEDSPAIEAEQTCEAPPSPATFALQSLEERLVRFGFIFPTRSPRTAPAEPLVAEFASARVPAKRSARKIREGSTPSRSRNVIPMICRREAPEFPISASAKPAPSKQSARAVRPQPNVASPKSAGFRSEHRIA